MNQLGNLAIVCARKENVLMQIFNDTISVHINTGPSKKSFYIKNGDNEEIDKIIYLINFGEFKENETNDNNK